jgi:hypothetical protein
MDKRSVPMTEVQAYNCDHLVLDDDDFYKKRMLRCRNTAHRTQNRKETTLDFCRVCPDWEHVEQKVNEKASKPET